MNKQQFDIILFGASSFVGRIVARHLQALIDQGSFAVPENFSWAMAGRNEKTLHAIKAVLGPTGQQVSLIIADAHDELQLRRMCQQGRVIISTVGPYALHGETLVRVCAESGTDYCDLTGEVQWIRRMLDRYGKIAQSSGARMVHCCGFDCIPSDLGVYYLQQLAQHKLGHVCGRVKMGVKIVKGGLSGGTVASMLNVAKEATRDKNLRKQLANPYWLCPDDHPYTIRQPKAAVRFDTDFESWTTPFLMAAINTRIVHRSNALLRHQYGKNFLYSEEWLTGKRGQWRGLLIRWGLGLFYLLAAIPPSRWLLQKLFLPKPGQGPSEERQRSGLFKLLFVGLDSNGNKIMLEVAGDADPGYSGTARMLTQTALCLAFDIEPEENSGGFYTPAALLGNKLIKRLENYAGIRFNVVD